MLLSPKGTDACQVQRNGLVLRRRVFQQYLKFALGITTFVHIMVTFVLRVSFLLDI
jgi:hypothetical protein